MSQPVLRDSQSCTAFGGRGQPLASAYVVPHPTRPNEDTFCICPLWFGGLGLVSFAGVFDGHQGSEVSRFLAASLHQYVEACSMLGPDVATALCRAFQSADTALEAAMLNCPDAGSTATVALISAASIVVAHCGDSRALLCRNGRVLALTEDHRPTRLDERERVLGSGGQILWNEGERVMGILATTRAFGDRDLKQFGVIAEPEVAITSRTPEDEFLILATDGVFNVLSNEETGDVARRVVRRAIERGASRPAAIRMAAAAVGRFSRDRNSKDDITVVLVDLAPTHGSCPPAEQQDTAVVAQSRFAARATSTLHQHQHQHPSSPVQSSQQQQQQQQQQQTKQSQTPPQQLQDQQQGQHHAQYTVQSGSQHPHPHVQRQLPQHHVCSLLGHNLTSDGATHTDAAAGPADHRHQQRTSPEPKAQGATAAVASTAAATHTAATAAGPGCGQLLGAPAAGAAAPPSVKPQACAG